METKDQIKSELEKTRCKFQEILNSMNADSLNKPSKNLAWSNGEVVFHMTFAYMLIPRLWWIMKLFTHLPRPFSKAFAGILTFFTPLYEVVNKYLPKFGAKLYPLNKLGRKYDKVHASIIRKLNSMKPEDLELGMYYPQRWDKSNFKEYMTMKEVFLWSTIHFQYHLKRHLNIVN